MNSSTKELEVTATSVRVTDDALIVVEEAAEAGFKAPEGYEEIERRSYDDTEFVILRCN